MRTKSCELPSERKVEMRRSARSTGQSWWAIGRQWPRTMWQRTRARGSCSTSLTVTLNDKMRRVILTRNNEKWMKIYNKRRHSSLKSHPRSLKRKLLIPQCKRMGLCLRIKSKRKLLSNWKRSLLSWNPQMTCPLSKLNHRKKLKKLVRKFLLLSLRENHEKVCLRSRTLKDRARSFEQKQKYNLIIILLVSYVFSSEVSPNGRHVLSPSLLHL